ncbi:MAG: type II toxin-antitoxin system VapB family antitoxin [Dermatophilaceae bacterium]
MVTMNIKDPKVRELAMQLAARRGTSATGAIRQALIETLDRDTRDRAGLAERLMVLGRESAALPEPVLTDDDLYDERGLPR